MERTNFNITPQLTVISSVLGTHLLYLFYPIDLIMCYKVVIPVCLYLPWKIKNLI
jgi:hypothetical protein